MANSDETKKHSRTSPDLQFKNFLYNNVNQKAKFRKLFFAQTTIEKNISFKHHFFHTPVAQKPFDPSQFRITNIQIIYKKNPTNVGWIALKRQTKEI